jgi:predicted metal-dependent hydrolase
VTGLLVIGEPPVKVRLRRSARNRRLVLRVNQRAAGAVLTVPPGTSERAAIAFLESNLTWLRDRIAARGELIPVRTGTVLPFGDRTLTIRSDPGGRLTAADGVLHVPGAAQHLPGKVRAYLREAARMAFVARAGAHAERLDRKLGILTIRDTRSRWGSCTSDGNLMFSWRLIMAPSSVLDYVAAHEAAHLVEMNHSDRFWSVVASLSPDYPEHRRWLRQNGPDLHRYEFASGP